jgi:hypothetical protein
MEEVSVGGMQSGLTHTNTKVKLVECTLHTGEERKLGWVTGALLVEDERAGVEIRDQVSTWSQQLVQSLQAKEQKPVWLA